MRFHRATGMPLEHCKLQLERLTFPQFTKLLCAISNQRGPVFHDPIEDDAGFTATIESVRREAEVLADEEVERKRQEYRQTGLESLEFMLRRGHCRRTWLIMQRLLRERHGIEWFTPAQMCPGVCMD